MLDCRRLSPDPRIRLARGAADYEACVSLQRRVWGLADLEITSAIQLAATVHAGGLLLVAEEEDGEVVGFSYAFAALAGGEAHLHSDMLAVLPTARGRGIGLRLKWAQREQALERGLRLVTWTFDPLRAPNARLNLHHLGASAREYLPDFYGVTSSVLHHGLPTDRLLVRWELASGHVRGLAPGAAAERARRAGLADVNGFERALEAVQRAPGALPVPVPHGIASDDLLLEIPEDWDALCAADTGLARAWQQAVRGGFEAAFARGLAACDFVAREVAGRRTVGYRLRRP